MHLTALQNARLFFRTYLPQGAGETVVEIGSQNVNGSIRDVAPPNVAYVGVDFVQAKGVDVVLEDPYCLPFEDDSVDVCLSSSVFEHSELFWLLFLDVIRILKPGGLFYLNAPSNGAFHRYPVDAWRFYPDSGKALVNWAARNGVSVALLESFVSAQDRDMWSDFVAVFVKDAALADRHPRHILHTITNFTNGRLLGDERVLNFREQTEDMTRLAAATALLRRLRASAGPLAAPAPTLSADPWQGSHKVRMLAAPDWSDPQDRWAAALPRVCAGMTESDPITVGVVAPPAGTALPPSFVAFARTTRADIVVLPRPDEAGWPRLLAGVSAVLLTGAQPALRELARQAGVEVLDSQSD